MNSDEIDRLVKECVIKKHNGYEKCSLCNGLGMLEFDGSFYITCHKCEDGLVEKVPHYSTDLNDAWLVVEKIKEMGFSTEYQFMIELQKEITPQELKNKERLLSFGWLIFHLTPKAICLAALRTINKMEEI